MSVTDAEGRKSRDYFFQEAQLEHSSASYDHFCQSFSLQSHNRFDCAFPPSSRKRGELTPEQRACIAKTSEAEPPCRQKCCFVLLSLMRVGGAERQLKEEKHEEGEQARQVPRVKGDTMT